MNNKQKLMVGLLVVIALLSSVAYAGEKKVVVTLGKKEAVANGKKVSLDVPPQLVNGTLMVPFRFMGESLGANIEWNKKSGTASLAMETPTIEMYTEKNKASLTKLKELIEDKNTKRIWIEMYELTDSDILDSLKKRAEEKDIDIKIILDYRQHNDYAESDNAKYSRMVDFECNLENARNNKNCEVRWWQFCNDNYQKLHRKIFLFGKDTIWIGSSNISHYGLYDKNKEINLKIVDSKLASEFEEIFKKDWCDPDKNICQLVENLEEPCPKQP